MPRRCARDTEIFPANEKLKNNIPIYRQLKSTNTPNPPNPCPRHHPEPLQALVY